MAFNLDNYETVEVRLEKFIKDFPDFRIDTELESFQNDRFIVKAYLYRTFADSVAFTTGYAEEKVTDRGVNATSALENCETSAIGRALANAGYAAKGKRPSREEMVKVARVENDAKTPPAQFINTWDEFIDTPKSKEEPVSMEAAAQLIQQELGATPDEPIPHCRHGEMQIKEGNKNGKPWRGAMCSAGIKGGMTSEKCPPVWYVVSKSTGKWRLPDGVE
jgi:hypothetical protein